MVILGSGDEAGKHLTWTLAEAGHRTALIERGELGGACPNVACLPSKNLIHSAKLPSLMGRGPEFGIRADSVRIDMTGVQRQKREMVARLHEMRVQRTRASGVELIVGEGRFVAPRTIDIESAADGARRITGEKIFLVLGSRASLPEAAGLLEARPMTHVVAPAPVCNPGIQL